MKEILFPVEASEHWLRFCADLYVKLGHDLPGRCDNTQRFARELLEEGGYDVDGSLAYYGKYGGHCDCEILLNTDVFAVKS